MWVVIILIYCLVVLGFACVGDLCCCLVSLFAVCV